MITLTAQEVFNNSITFLRKQGHPARGRGDCRYRAPDGSMCAVGCLLTDVEAEGLDDRFQSSVAALVRDGLLPERLVPHVALLKELQQLHDSLSSNPKTFVAFLNEDAACIARKFGLEMPQ